MESDGGREGNDIGGRRRRSSFAGTHRLWVGVVVGRVRSPFVSVGSSRPWVGGSSLSRLWGAESCSWRFVGAGCRLREGAVIEAGGRGRKGKGVMEGGGRGRG